MKKQLIFRVMTATALMLALTFSSIAQSNSGTRQLQQQPKQTQQQPQTQPKADNKMPGLKSKEFQRLLRGETLREYETLKRERDATIPFEGAGTKANPYKIKNAANLKKLADLVNSVTAPYCDIETYYTQTANIDLSGIKHIPIGAYPRSFKGRYDGAGFTISNLRLDDDNAGIEGLFGAVDNNAIIRNVRLTKVFTAIDGMYVGALAGGSGGTISNCYVSVNNIAGHTYTGGLVGYNLGVISCCIVTGNGIVSGFINVGGIAGSNEGVIENCYTTVRVTANSGRVGGIAGDNTDGRIQYCYTTGPVDAVGSSSGDTTGCGGIAGAEGIVRNCVALNKSITINARDNGIGRVNGITAGANNYARSNMALQNGNGNLAPTAGLSTKDGENITASNYDSPRWWVTIGFTGEPWLYNPNRMPHLNGFPGLTQNPTVTP